jgi:hypothetical protein
MARRVRSFLRCCVLVLGIFCLASCPTKTPDTTPPEDVPVLVKPIQALFSTADLRPIISWTGVEEAASYELQAGEDPGFTSIAYDWKGLTDTTFWCSEGMRVSSSAPVGMRYYLRVRAVDDAGNAGAWSGEGQLRYVSVARVEKDFNGDGYSDVIVGAPGPSGEPGHAYIYFGGPSMDDVADVTLTGESADDGFGSGVASADVNGDGYADALVGASKYGGSMGCVYVFFGGSPMDNVADVKSAGKNLIGNLGTRIASAGDVNADGYDDVISGEFGGNAVYLYYGGKTMDGVADLTITDSESSYRLASVASAGDVNGDGYSDVIIGSYQYASRGRAFIFLGGSAMDSVPDVIFEGEDFGSNLSSSQFGISVASARDVNGDGYGDVIIGAFKYPDTGGRAYIYFGSPFMDSVADLALTGDTDAKNFGICVSSTGDVNGDGFADVLVGDYYCNSQEGRAYLFLGGPTMDATVDLVMDGLPHSNFGWSLSCAGDLDGDGFSDLIVGAYEYNFEAGRALCYLGGASMDNVADHTMGGADGSRFGNSVY